MKAYRDKNPGFRARQAVKARLRETGWDESRWKESLAAQNGRCAICAKILRLVSSRRRDAACADHDHTSQTPRGILCSACNIGLGCFNDDFMLLTSAVNYLEKHRA